MGVAIRNKKCAASNDNKQLRCDRLTDLFNAQTARKQRSQETGFIADVFEPCRPTQPLQHDHLGWIGITSGPGAVVSRVNARLPRESHAITPQSRTNPRSLS